LHFDIQRKFWTDQHAKQGTAILNIVELDGRAGGTDAAEQTVRSMWQQKENEAQRVKVRF
jgi:hypothetical protein